MLRDAENSTTRPRSAARALPTLPIDYLWLIIVLAGFAICVALSLSPPNDFWWQLKAGQVVAERGIPTTNIFAWTLPADQPYTYATWLGEWLFYALYRLGGLSAVVLARNLLAPAALALVAIDARQRSGSWRLAALAALLAGALAINNLIVRTQVWSWLPFALYLVILNAYVAGRLRARALAALPPLMAFWVNAHGAFVLGLALIGLVAAGETLRAILPAGQADANARTGWSQLWPLYLAALATLAATLINPSGTGIFGYVAKLLTDPSSQGLVSEWQPPTTRSAAGAIFFATAIILLLAFAFGRRRPTLTDLLLTCAFLWLAWTGQRYVVWFGMVAMPVLVQSLAARSSVPSRREPRNAANLALALAFAAGVVAVQPPLVGRLPLPDVFRQAAADVPGAPLAFAAATPVAAAEYLRAHPEPSERLFNEMGYGSYLIWALYPDVRVFIDARVELYPIEQWQDYIAIGQARDYNALLIDKYGVTRVMLDRKIQPKLSEALERDRLRWTLEYRDPQTEIYRRSER